MDDLANLVFRGRSQDALVSQCCLPSYSSSLLLDPRADSQPCFQPWPVLLLSGPSRLAKTATRWCEFSHTPHSGPWQTHCANSQIEIFLRPSVATVCPESLLLFSSSCPGLPFFVDGYTLPLSSMHL